MNHLRTGAKLKALTVTLLAGTIAMSTGCSNDLPTDAAETPGADALPNQVAPTNDDFDAAEVIPALPFTDAISTTDATPAEDDPPNCFGGGPTVWYEFTPTEDTRITANTFGSNYDTGLSVYTGTRGDLTEIACNDDAGSLQSAVTFDAAAGVTYFFMVGAFGGGPGGNLVFNVSVAPPPLEVDLTIESFGSVNSATGSAVIRGTVTCSRPALVEISGELRQRKGRVFLDAEFFTFVECDGTTSWEVEVTAENGLLTGGRAEVSVFALFFDPDTAEFASDSESGTVRLRGARK